MTRRLDKIQTRMNSPVIDPSALGALLQPEVITMLTIDIINDGSPAVVIIHQIRESRSVNDVESDFEVLFYNIY